MTALSTPRKRRWMALWLTRLPTDRLKRAGVAPSEPHPFALYAKSGNAFTLSAVDACAAKAGLRAGMPLADGRAMLPGLAAFEADHAADLAMLRQIALWCDRFTPLVAIDAPDGLFLDISGCAHLFGGEAALLEAVHTRLKAQGFAARAAIAPTPGAAWASAHFGAARQIDDDRLNDSLAPLPIAALRLMPDAIALLKRLGVKTIGQIAHAPRAPFEARAGKMAMLRLDQAFGRAVEALTPLRPPPPIFALRRLVEPIIALEAVLIAVGALCEDLCVSLDRNGVGARLLRLSLFGVDGGVRALDIGMTNPEQSAKPMMRLLRERLNITADMMNAEFGFEIIRLDAVEIAPIIPRETDLAPVCARDVRAEGRVIDALRARLGAGRVGCLAFRPVHAPERASVHSGAWQSSTHPPPPVDGVMRRPLRLFPRAQLIETIASAPDGPPARFRWRRVLREVARAEGPERIEPNWLRAPCARHRDYYRVEDAQGRRYWLYREGHYADAEPPRWFLHGLFA